MSEQDTDTIVQEPVNSEQSGSEQAGSEQAGSEQAGSEQAAAESAASKKKTRKQSTARKTRSVELTLTVTGTAEGEWQAELTHAGKRVVQGLSIPASAVSKAASELHEDISEAIETVISDARQQHEAKLAELEAEMERVKKTLADLES
ncbi:DUF6319 family protein [Haloactinomyces albus]|uniref:Polyhydroxyalkanoate synthesis regulator phasin n=1 Tax=Haloactinomyces albus TaxID=1352928 RepID=A0AAE4CMI6_9ACTN|nr:DUF6319 family protein [Haloactinomyces albus]MDR7302456.1 polyhydroxyalkanoate synthesis regulator phasin [Haloactinomyces albus]